MRVQFLSFIACTAVACTSHVGGYSENDAGSPDVVGEPDADLSTLTCETEFANVTLEPMPPTVNVLVDASGSMTRDFGGLSRWRAVERALVDPTVGVVSRLASDVSFGATVFHSDNGHLGGTCPRMSSVVPIADNADAVRQLIADSEPHGDTPTSEAIGVLTTELAPLNTSYRTILLLATDGNPDNCNGPDQHTLFSQVLTENAVDQAYAAGVETIVLSVGTDATMEHLQRVANLGSGQPVHTGAAPYYIATDPDELVTAFEAMISDVIPTCVFQHGLMVTMDQAEAGTIWVDGLELDYGMDWTWVDPSAIELLGNACGLVLGDDSVTVEGEFPC